MGFFSRLFRFARSASVSPAPEEPGSAALQPAQGASLFRVARAFFTVGPGVYESQEGFFDSIEDARQEEAARARRLGRSASSMSVRLPGQLSSASEGLEDSSSASQGPGFGSEGSGSVNEGPA